MEETGKKVFLPVSSGRKWKKLEESGRNVCMKPNKDTNKPVEISFQIRNTGMSMQICISQISGILQGASARPSVVQYISLFHVLKA